jgi:hypothetical protein
VPTVPWAPSLSDVARHIPTRTRDTRSPGSDRLLDTFTPDTTPSDAAASIIIDNACNSILSRTEGLLDQPDTTACRTQARLAAEWRAAADIEIAYPGRDADIRVYTWLDTRAKDELTSLLVCLGILPPTAGAPGAGGGAGGAGGGTGPGGGFPVEDVAWSAPDPPPWADRDPDWRTPAGWRRTATGYGSSRTARTRPGEG